MVDSKNNLNQKDVPRPPALSTPQLSRKFQRQSVLPDEHQQQSIPPEHDETQELLRRILETLQDSSIAEKGDKDVRSRFWANYDQVSKEEEDKFIERTNIDLQIVLLCSGLISAIDVAFIIAMQPGSTTTVLIQNTSQDVTVSSLIAPSVKVPDGTWFQGLAYVALSLSLLAALGALLGKQWISHYKSNDVHGSLEKRGKYRQQKSDGLEAWHFHAVLQSFPILLQISLLLFGVAISAFVWSQQGKLAIVVVASMAFGVFFYWFIIVASLRSPQCPFQTPISIVIRMLYRRIYTYVKDWRGEVSLPPDPEEFEESLSDVPSMKWIFESSADPEVISSVAWLVPSVKWTPELHMRTISLRLLSTFKACFPAGAWTFSARRRALACGRALHHLVCDESIGKDVLPDMAHFDAWPLEMWSRWQGLSLPWGLERCKEIFAQYATTLDEGHDTSEARDALRLAIVTGCPGFLQPTDVALIWDGVFDWKDDPRTTQDFDWLVDFLVHFRKSETRDFDAMGDALLALSAMRDLGSDSRRDNYLDSIIFAMEADKPSRLRHTALRAMFDARFKLVEMVDKEEREFREKLLGELAPALLNATKPIAPQRFDDEPDAVFNPRRDDYYLRLIFTLAKQSDWRAHLERAGHIERCTSLLGHVIRNSSSTSLVTSHSYYLAAILIRMNSSGGYRSSLRAATQASALDTEPTNMEEYRPTTNLVATLPAAPEAPTPLGFPDNISEQEWWKLLKRAWWAMRWNDLHHEAEAVEALPSIVTYTLDLLETPSARYDAGSLVRSVDRIYEALDDSKAKLEMKRLQDALGNRA
ncbi:uncharacterized protein F5891DRAFT_1184060 [Suillus fuscotomentosus]|uniref:DUF6535 domain-containing protein n=1 Tax=Suillus fuscotomentosus TaxID=1912939 RepID=A0AAD4EEG9_9AGAM|nr:uncharacterized protein F5891DRAFT_1184060 [Suillus fuscotomentosus]KAG1904642.1 hypothetical protein F5891DRAFT_1184060 [Suillus fuscotomentosus]